MTEEIAVDPFEEKVKILACVKPRPCITFVFSYSMY